MTYERAKKTYKLIFEEPEYEGLEVRTTSVPLGDFLKISTLADVANGQEAGGSNNADMLTAVADLFKAFAKALISWNLTEDGEPVPATYEGILTQDMEFMLAVVRAWMEAIASVSVPLDKSSIGGVTSPTPSIPMETLSQSLTS